MKIKKSRNLFALTLMACSLYSTYSTAESTPTPIPTKPLWYYLSSSLTGDVFRIEEETGEVIDKLTPNVPGAFASFSSSDSDFFVAASASGEVYRFDRDTAKFKDIFVKAHSGGMVKPIVPTASPSGEYLYVNDIVTNNVYRFDGHTGEFIDLFIGPATGAPINGPFMPVFSPWPEHKGIFFIVSGYTNSVQMYNERTKEYLGDFVTPGSGGVLTPIGSVFGPDGNLYLSNLGTNSVKRYDGRTGAYIDDFVPTGSGGLSSPRALEFGGHNSDLYVVSNGTNTVLKYDRVTGKYLGISAVGSVVGFGQPRGLMFSARPNTFILASPSIISSDDGNEFVPVTIDFFSAKGKLDGTEIITLISVENDDPNDKSEHDVKGADLGVDDRKFWLRTKNNTDHAKTFTVTYRIGKDGQGSVIATTKISVSPAKKCKYLVEYEQANLFIASVRITNTSSNPINGWNLDWEYSDGSKVKQFLNAVVSGKNPYHATNTSRNATIEAGESVDIFLAGKKAIGVKAEVPTLIGNVCH